MKCARYPLLRFLRGELNTAEAGRVATHVSGCRVCRQRVRIVVMLDEVHHLRRPRRHRIRWLAVAAALAFFLGPLTLETILFQLQAPHSGHLAVREPHPLVLLSNRSAAGSGPPRDAYQAYLRADYSGAESLLSDSADEMDLLVRGVSLYMLGRETEALEVLEQVPEDGAWSEAARWYEANALLRMGEAAAALSILSRLAVENGGHSERAARLVRRLGGAP